jgi:hypothetical protein
MNGRCVQTIGGVGQSLVPHGADWRMESASRGLSDEGKRDGESASLNYSGTPNSPISLE